MVQIKGLLILVLVAIAAIIVQATPSPAKDIHPKELTTGKHWKGGPDLRYLGIPGYEKVAIPDDKIEQMAQVPHSAIAAAIEDAVMEEMDSIEYQEFGSHPAEGLYLQSFKGTNFTEADNYAREHDVYLPFTITNPTKSGMCILAGATNWMTGEAFHFKLNYTEDHKMLFMAPRSMIQVGNIIGREGKQLLNGRAEAHFDCDKTCTECQGTTKAANTLAEWTFETSGDSSDGFWSNLSNVDGLSANVNMTAYNEDMEIRHQRSCQTTAKEVKKACPPQLFWQDGKNVGCTSQCKFTNSDEHCCTGEHNTPQTCRASSSFNSELCPDAYAWAFDDPTHIDWSPTKLRGVYLEFAPIR